MKNLNKLTIAFILLFLIKPLFSQDNNSTITVEKKRIKNISIQDFSATNLSPSKAKRVKNTFEKAFFENTFFSLKEINPSDPVLKTIKERLDFLKESRTIDSAIELGKLLAVDYIITGDVIKEENGNIIINIKVISINQKKVIMLDSLQLDEDDDLQSETKYFAKNVIEKIRDLENKKPVKLYFKAKSNFIKPYGFFSERVGNGIALSLNVETKDILFKNFILGAEVEYIYFNGVSNETHHASILPMVLTTGYYINYYNFYLTPYIGAGYSYNQLYEYSSNTGTDYEKVTNNKPIVKVGADAGFKLSEFLQLYANSYTATIFESEKNLHYLALGFGISAKF